MDDYLVKLHADLRESFEHLRQQIHVFVPEVKEKISCKFPVLHFIAHWLDSRHIRRTYPFLGSAQHYLISFQVI